MDVRITSADTVAASFLMGPTRDGLTAWLVTFLSTWWLPTILLMIMVVVSWQAWG